MPNESFDENNLLDEEYDSKKPIYMMSVEEKEHHVIYDENGLPNYYDRETDAWMPVRAFVSREDILEVKKNYPLPRLYPFRLISHLLFPFLIGAIAALSVYGILSAINQNLSLGYYFLIGGIIAFLGILFNLGDIIIFFVQVYQKKAPDEVRERCNLHPSCSFYCIYAIMKYGALIGIIKTIGRLHRCKGQDEVDEP